MTAQNDRYFTPDILKAVGILLVVFGHVLVGAERRDILSFSGPFGTLTRDIYLFHMPLFFFLSGLFFQKIWHKNGTLGVIKKNALALLIPLIIWSYIQFSLQYLASSYAHVHLTLVDVLTAPYPPQQQFWFLGALFLTTSLTALCYRSKGGRGILLGLCFFWIFLRFVLDFEDFFHLPQTDDFIPFWIYQAVVHAPFFILGALLGPDSAKKYAHFYPLALVLFFVALFTNQETTQAPIVYDPPGLVSIPYAFVCVLALFVAVQGIQTKFMRNPSSPIWRWVLFIGQNSMIIYLAHIIIIALTRTVLLKCGLTMAWVHISLETTLGLFLPLLAVPVATRLNRKGKHPALHFVLPYKAFPAEK